MSLLTMVAPVSPDASADHLDVILQARIVMLSCCMTGLLEAHRSSCRATSVPHQCHKTHQSLGRGLCEATAAERLCQNPVIAAQ